MRHWTYLSTVGCTLLFTFVWTAGGCSGDGRSCSSDDDCFKGEVCRSTSDSEGKVCVAKSPDAGGRDTGDSTGDSSGSDTAPRDTGPTDTISPDSVGDDTLSPDPDSSDAGEDTDACASSRKNEVIDGKDNDCDGKTDELFATVDMEDDELICGLTVDDDIYCWGSPNRLGNFSVSFPISSATYEQLAVAKSHICARDANDSIDCWGAAGVSDPEKPPSGTYREVDVGSRASCAIAASSGHIDCWGTTSGSRMDKPFQRIAVGSNYCGIDSNWNVECWGASIPAALKNDAPTDGRAMVETRDDFACAISQNDGSVTCWGAGNSPDPPNSAPDRYAEVELGAPVDLSTNEVELYACGLGSKQGTIACWGETANAGTPPSGTFLDIAAYSNGGCAVAMDHTVECWGTASGPP